jgi:hypothetical protein
MIIHRIGTREIGDMTRAERDTIPLGDVSKKGDT